MLSDLPSPAALTDPSRRRRVLALRDLAVARLGVARGVAWCFRPNPLLLDVEPAAAAWYGPRTAAAAAAALGVEGVAPFRPGGPAPGTSP